MGSGAVFPDMEETHTPEAAETPDSSDGSAASAPDRRRRVPAAVVAVGWAGLAAAGMTAAGYAADRWAATGLPMEPLPGSPWPWLTAWAVLTFLAALLLQWATHGIDYDGRWGLVALPGFAGVRLSLAHHPDPVLLYGYGLAALALGAAGIAWWRRRRTGATGRR
ncbi:hypothetical protein [Streptomyces sp. NPDC048606]|uniref:hypothetical protein n=1 Tax=Streptomyces sp. NPDC048606 TaxID=3154726 RepID=UPI0034344430